MSEYRYTLHRALKPRAEISKSGTIWETTVVFVMLNPSTADAVNDDPTIRRCKRFAEERGYSGLVVVNVFPYRATRPKHLAEWLCSDHAAVFDAMGTNDLAVKQECDGRDVVIAWGAHVRPYAAWWATTHDLIKAVAKNVYRLGPTTKEGYPRHPLYLPADAEWEAA